MLFDQCTVYSSGCLASRLGVYVDGSGPKQYMLTFSHYTLRPRYIPFGSMDAQGDGGLECIREGVGDLVSWL